MSKPFFQNSLEVLSIFLSCLEYLHYLLEHFYKTSLKSLSDNTNICIILELISVLFFFSVQVEIVFYWYFYMLINFGFYTGHSDYFIQLNSGFRFQPALCDLCFLYQFSFQTFQLFGIFPHLCHPVAKLGIEQCFKVLSFYIWCLGLIYACVAWCETMSS